MKVWIIIKINWKINNYIFGGIEFFFKGRKVTFYSDWELFCVALIWNSEIIFFSLDESRWGYTLSYWLTFTCILAQRNQRLSVSVSACPSVSNLFISFTSFLERLGKIKLNLVQSDLWAGIFNCFWKKTKSFLIGKWK